MSGIGKRAVCWTYRAKRWGEGNLVRVRPRSSVTGKIRGFVGGAAFLVWSAVLVGEVREPVGRFDRLDALAYARKEITYITGYSCVRTRLRAHWDFDGFIVKVGREGGV